MKKILGCLCLIILLIGYGGTKTVNAGDTIYKESCIIDSFGSICDRNNLEASDYSIPEDTYTDMDELVKEYIEINVPQDAEWVKNNMGSLYLCNSYAGNEGLGGSAFIDSFFCQFFDVYTFVYMEGASEKAVVVVDYTALQGVYSDDDLCMYTKNFSNISEGCNAFIYSMNSDTESWEYKKEIPIKCYFDEGYGDWCLQVEGKNWKNGNNRQPMRCIFSFQADIEDKMELDTYYFPYYYVENTLLRENVLWIGDWGIEIFGLKWIKLFVKIAIPAAIIIYLVKKWLHIRHVKKMMGKR